jgi:hypothetical protein
MLTIFRLKNNLIDLWLSTYLKPTTCIKRDKEITFISANLVPIGESRNFYTKLVKSIMIWTKTLNQPTIYS